MYPLGSQFEFDKTKGVANQKAIFQGEKYRITVLTERLIRLEYQEDGKFEDRLTEMVINRSFPLPKFQFKEDAVSLEISTKYFQLFYLKNRSFAGSKMNPIGNLRINLVNSDRIWNYGHPEVRNYGAPGISMDTDEKFGKGLYSADGFATIDDSNGLVIEDGGTLTERTTKGIDIYAFFYLKDFALCLKDYFGLTGFPSLVPRYALGNWWSRNVSYDEKQVEELVQEFDDNDIPLSILLLNKDWHKQEEKNKKYAGFSFQPDRFPKPEGMVQFLHSKGIRLGLTLNGFDSIYDYENNYSKVIEYLRADEKGRIPFQMLDSKFIDVYLKILIHPLDNMGIDFYFLDIADTKKLDELRLLQHYHFYDMRRNFKRRPMVLSRNTNLAPHRYPVLYSGKTIVSWDTLKKVPLYNASASNIGVSFWSHDIGGYYKGIEDNELYTRFVQLGTFSPILKLGSETGKYYKREPWRWSVKTYRIAKDYLQLRHRLIPYLYAESYKYSKYGMPIVQPIYYQMPELYDDELYKNEYFFGTELFVCPIISKKEYLMNRVIHKFYMPNGTWYDFMTGKKFPGGKKYVSFFKDEDYPVFAKSGSIIPFGTHENMNDTTPPKDMEIHIFPGKNNQYNLYEDDGVSDLYRQGYYLLTSIDYNYLPNNYTVIIRAIEGKSGIIPEKRNYKIRFRNTKQADDVVVFFNDGQIKSNSWIEGTDFIVEVKEVPTIGQLTINCKGKDIEIDALRLINDDIESIINDLQIETEMKEIIDSILFSNLPIKKKRIEIRKLRRKGLERKFVRLFLKLLEYIEQI